MFMCVNSAIWRCSAYFVWKLGSRKALVSSGVLGLTAGSPCQFSSEMNTWSKAQREVCLRALGQSWSLGEGRVHPGQVASSSQGPH